MPQYPSPAPPPKRRHRGLLITAVVLGIALIACVAIVVSAVGGDDTTGTAADEPNEAEAAPTFGQPVRDGMFEFTITDVTCGQQSIGEDPFTETAQGEFCLVDMNVRNVGTEARTFDASYQKAMTAAGETYQADDSLAIAANEGESAVFNNINPGNQVDGTVAFDVPKGTKLTTIELHDDILSGGVQAPLE